MGRWIKIRGNERPAKSRRDERCLERYEKLVIKLQMKAFTNGYALTEKQRKALFAYGIALQAYGRMRYLNEREVKVFDALVEKSFLKMLFAEEGEAVDRSEVDQFLRSLPARYLVK